MGEKKEKKEKKDKEKKEKATVRSAPDGSDNKYWDGNAGYFKVDPILLILIVM